MGVVGEGCVVIVIFECSDVVGFFGVGRLEIGMVFFIFWFFYVFNNKFYYLRYFENI